MLAAIILKNFRATGSNLLMNRDIEDAGTVIGQASASAQVFFDMPTPSVQATMAIATAKLALITGDDSYSKTANELMASAPAMAGAMLSNSVATVGLALEYRANGGATVAIVGPNGDARARSFVEDGVGELSSGENRDADRIGSRRRSDAGRGAGDVRIQRCEGSSTRVRMRRNGVRDSGRDAGETRAGDQEIRRQGNRQDDGRQRRASSRTTADVNVQSRVL